ncbi:hypothetical protein R9X47_09390 [Wukongibacter baidiensis]|uniref:hypothetical protein n=1 Tax=Wukongibacter baidiensis TaxID=1723361 RepID=UPI003D7F8431
MKKITLVILLMVTLIANGCSGVKSKEVEKEVEPSESISLEEMKKIDLYVLVMTAAFNEENGGNGFIAVEMKSLEGLSDKGKEEVLNKLKSIAKNVYPFEEVKDDSTKFEKDKDGNLRRSLNGTLLSVRVEKMSKNKATIEATSWFGNLGAVFPKYKAIYKNGKWNLELLSMAIS